MVAMTLVEEVATIMSSNFSQASSLSSSAVASSNKLTLIGPLQSGHPAWVGTDSMC